MRQIKFRAWDGKHMHTFDNFTEILDYCDISGWNVRPNDLDYRGEWICGESQSKTPDFTLMQFTGVQDCNGKDIYEGDIVQWGLTDNPRARLFKRVVTYDSDRAMFLPNDMKNDVEIIGNIYETPELLNKEH